MPPPPKFYNFCIFVLKRVMFCSLATFNICSKRLVCLKESVTIVPRDPDARTRFGNTTWGDCDAA